MNNEALLERAVIALEEISSHLEVLARGDDGFLEGLPALLQEMSDTDYRTFKEVDELHRVLHEQLSAVNEKL